MVVAWLSKTKAAWLARQEAAWQAEYAPQLAAAQAQYQRQLEAFQQRLAALHPKADALQSLQAHLADQEQLLTDRQVAVARANEECRTQLRLLEAKASPDSVWVEAFSRGFEKAWDAMWPLLAEGVKQAQTAIEQKAIDATLARLDQTVIERAESLGHGQARSISQLREKRADFLQKRTQASERQDRQAVVKYDHYLETLEWMLHANGLRADEPVSQ